MDRADLARRNLQLAQTWHQRPARHALRDLALAGLAKLPLAPPQRSKTNRVLVIRPDHLGDALLMTPALQFIKRQQPQTELHVICGDWAAEILAPFTEIDLLLTLDFPGFQRQHSTSARNAYLLALQSARRLRAIGYDSALIMRPDHWWGAMLAFLAGIQERVGYNTASARPFLSRRLPQQREHAALQNMRLAAFWMGAGYGQNVKLNLAVSADDASAMNKLLAERGIAPTQPIICIHPGSGMPSKLWQAQKWAAVADQVARRSQAAIIFTGGSAENSLIEIIAEQMQTKSVSVASLTSAGQLAALYRRASVVLGPDSGAMHVAAAVQTPTVTLFGPADPAEFAPWGDGQKHAALTSDIACRPCRILDWRDDPPANHPCVRDISVRQVLAATQRVLAAQNAGG